MLGEVARKLTNSASITSLKINPLWVVDGEIDSYFMCEDIIFCPLFDEYTNKHLMSDPRDAKALLALNYNDQKRYGVEFAFQTISSTDFNSITENYADAIEDKINQLKFTIKRTLIAPGSASIYFVILRMDNYHEELCFIRNYKTMSPDIKLLFVTSKLEILTPELDKVPYYTGEIDEIMTNLIDWYRK